MNSERTFESDFSTVWKAIDASVKDYKISDRKTGTLETDWIYGQSRDKFQEYKINDFPRKTYLQTRFKFTIESKKVMGGTQIKVTTQEEIERLNHVGESLGYTRSSQPDPSRANELLDRIQMALLAAPA